MGIRLKRLYDWESPKDTWVFDAEICRTCKGKGKVANEELTEIIDCPVSDPDSQLHYWEDPLGNRYEWYHGQEKNTGRYVQARYIPPVDAVEVQDLSRHQHFSDRLVDRAVNEGWMSVEDSRLTLLGKYVIVEYELLRRPGRYEDEVIHYYDCELIEIRERSTEDL